MRQRRGAVGRGQRSGRVFADLLRPALLDPGLHQVEGADDAGQQVVEVVGDAAGELADGLHLLRLAQQVFDRPLLRDVAADDVEQLAFGHRVPHHGQAFAVLADHAVDEAVDRFAPRQLRDHRR